ncbi:MAG: DEAD/DEAH box helicase [Lachnospiraceae bacterium]|nr:DEAD/DEAH box helicase [Lachnospiraceae bacterium]
MGFIFTQDDFYLEFGKDEKLPEALRQWYLDFMKDKYLAWYQLGLKGKCEHGDNAMTFLYMVSDAFFKILTSQPDIEIAREQVRAELDEETWERLESAIPYALGVEYVNRAWVNHAFFQFEKIYKKEIVSYQGTVAMYLAEKGQNLHVPERIFFHLVENKDSEYPFAFLATYATKGEDDSICHMPLSYALTEYKADREKLLDLLSCLNRAAQISEFVGQTVESGEMFHPLRLTGEEAYRLLKDIPAIEETGILCRIPNWWRKKAAVVNMTISMGEERPSFLGFDTILSLQPALTVDGVPLIKEDIAYLLSQTNGLAFLKGKWIEVDHGRLQKLLLEMEENQEDITLLEALRGDGILKEQKKNPDVGPLISNGKWLTEFLQKLRKPELMKKARVPAGVNAKLRPYQQNGYTWLFTMYQLGFGACLADDMGLGKTLQVLTFLEKIRREKDGSPKRILLIVPASLLGNWKKETEKFVPGMDVEILHGRPMKALVQKILDRQSYLTVTTYGMTVRIKELQQVLWDCLILDEAQAIKNPVTKQTHAIKNIPAKMRIAMTGTPIENDLSNLWSLFDFLNKGLLGTSKDFKSYARQLAEHPEEYAHLKFMISPFMLRRIKTDKKIISDLPEKVEANDYVALSKKQIVLYRKTVAEAAEKLETLKGIARKGVILGTILHLKQICNHPAQYLGTSDYTEADSGKFVMLREICETIFAKRERVLVFTQFKEMTEPLSRFLAQVFHREGLVLHGGVPVKRRSQLVEKFNGEEYVPYMVLSVKAGGTGLNLTKSNHVIHFDRWWNPAVENQATDRAFRIGQQKNVFVHKLICEKTIEEKIDVMIDSKKELAENVIGSGGENWITEMSDEELLSVLRLDI